MPTFDHDKPGQLIWTGGRRDVARQLAAMQRLINDLAARDVNVGQLAELTPDMGEIRAGRFVASSTGGDPTDSGFSGTFIDADGLTFASSLYHIGGVNAGTLQWGGNSNDGSFYFSAGSALIDDSGITLSGLGTLITMSATANSVTSTGLIGMEVPSDGASPVMFLRQQTTSTERVVNGGIETGSLGNWTYTSAGTQNISASSAAAKTGTYSIRAERVGGDANGSLTSDRILVNQGTVYTWSIWHNANATTANYLWRAHWYNDPSAGSQIGSNVALYNGSQYTIGEWGTWVNFTGTIKAPVGAQSLTLELNWSSSAGQVIYADDISITATNFNGTLQLRPQPTVVNVPLYLDTLTSPDNPESGYEAVYGNTTYGLRHLSYLGQDNRLLEGDTAAAVQSINDATLTTTISKTVKANSLGTKGFIVTRVYISHMRNNATAANRQLTLTYNFGSFSQTQTMTPGQSANRLDYYFDFITFNIGATNSQMHIGTELSSGGGVAGTWNTGSVQRVQNTSSIDTTADTTVSITLQNGGAGASAGFDAVASSDGPYYGA